MLTIVLSMVIGFLIGFWLLIKFIRRSRKQHNPYSLRGLITLVILFLLLVPGFASLLGLLVATNIFSNHLPKHRAVIKEVPLPMVRIGVGDSKSPYFLLSGDSTEFASYYYLKESPSGLVLHRLELMSPLSVKETEGQEAKLVQWTEVLDQPSRWAILDHDAEWELQIPKGSLFNQFREH